jgi:hypothetical protein
VTVTKVTKATKAISSSEEIVFHAKMDSLNYADHEWANFNQYPENSWMYSDNLKLRAAMFGKKHIVRCIYYNPYLRRACILLNQKLVSLPDCIVNVVIVLMRYLTRDKEMRSRLEVRDVSRLDIHDYIKSIPGVSNVDVQDILSESFYEVHRPDEDTRTFNSMLSGVYPKAPNIVDDQSWPEPTELEKVRVQTVEDFRREYLEGDWIVEPIMNLIPEEDPVTEKEKMYAGILSDVYNGMESLSSFDNVKVYEKRDTQGMLLRGIKLDY